jgi:hypothetical protein
VTGNSESWHVLADAVILVTIICFSRQLLAMPRHG